MSDATTSPRERVLTMHTSADGPHITHVRGTVLSNAIENLRAAEVYDDYLRVIPEAHAKFLSDALAVTWIPVAHVVAHYRAVDELKLSRRQFEEIGRRNASRIADTFLGFALRRVRTLGVDTLKQTAMKFGSLHDRMFRGGRAVVLDTGPKDLVFEILGAPFARSRSFRAGFETYGQALAEAFCKVAYVKVVRPRAAQIDAVALAVSWV